VGGLLPVDQSRDEGGHDSVDQSANALIYIHFNSCFFSLCFSLC
jgi:hypothetical protein